MERKDKRIEFLSYIKTPLSEDSIIMLHNANDIKYDKCVLFGDYVQSLFMIIFDTYMGDEVTLEDDKEQGNQKIKHFEWCWLKNINNFKDEGIIFNDTDESFNYFIEFALEVFYNTSGKDLKKHIPKTICSLWEDVFSYKKMKTRSDMDNFIEIYKILDKSLQKG